MIFWIRLVLGIIGIILAVYGADSIFKHDWSITLFPVQTVLMVSVGVFIVLFTLSNRFR